MVATPRFLAAAALAALVPLTPLQVPPPPGTTVLTVRSPVQRSAWFATARANPWTLHWSYRCPEATRFYVDRQEPSAGPWTVIGHSGKSGSGSRTVTTSGSQRLFTAWAGTFDTRCTWLFTVTEG